MDRYFCYVSGADFPSGTLNKQTYLASGEGTARACQSRFGAHLLLAKMNQGYSHSRLPQMWFWPVYTWASHWEGSLSEHAEWCGFADKASFFLFFFQSSRFHQSRWHMWVLSPLYLWSLCCPFQPVHTFSELFNLKCSSHGGWNHYHNISCQDTRVQLFWRRIVHCIGF